MKSFLWKIYAYTFLDHFILVYPVYALLFRENGLSEFQIATLFVIWSAVTLTFEVPTGLLADKYSRRNLLIYAQILKGIGYIFWLLGGYALYALGFALWGFAGSLVSGTFESFVYDELKANGREQEYERVTGRLFGIRFVGITLAVLLGGFVSEFGFGYALVPSIVVPFLAGATLLLITSVRSVRSTGERTYWKVLRDALREAKNNPRLLRIMSFMAIIFGVSGASDEIWPLFFDDIGITLTIIGIIFAIANGIAALAGFTAHRWELPGKRVYLFMLIGSIAILQLAYLQTPAAVALSFIAVYVLEVTRVKLETRLQHTVSSNQRATVSSVNSLLLEIVSMIFYFTVGTLAAPLGISIFLWLFGSITAAVSVFYLVTRSTDRRAFSFASE